MNDASDRAQPLSKWLYIKKGIPQGRFFDLDFVWFALSSKSIVSSGKLCLPWGSNRVRHHNQHQSS